MKAMFEVIKHDGDANNLVYKFDGEDFNTKSRLVVQQGQEAIFNELNCMVVLNSIINGGLLCVMI